MSTPLDAHGQPLIRAFSAKRIANRSVDELIGLCKGITADGKVVKEEADFLIRWLEANPAATKEWPGDIIAARICEALQDGVLDEEEQKDLYDLLTQATGGEELKNAAVNAASKLPLDNPPPAIEFENRIFCFTGKFAFGPRKACEAEVKALGGQIQSSITQKTNYLVVGLFGSTDWAHSTHGRKIEKAVTLRDYGHPIAVIAEDHWTESLTLQTR